MTFCCPEELGLLAWPADEKKELGRTCSLSKRQCPASAWQRFAAVAKPKSSARSTRQEPRCCWPGDHFSFVKCNARWAELACLWVPGFSNSRWLLADIPSSAVFQQKWHFADVLLGKNSEHYFCGHTTKIKDCTLILEVFVNKINISCAWVWPKAEYFKILLEIPLTNSNGSWPILEREKSVKTHTVVKKLEDSASAHAFCRYFSFNLNFLWLVTFPGTGY